MRDSEARKRASKDPWVLAGVVVKDSKSTDRKRKQVNDLDRAFVVPLISKPCTYCGESELRMTLDRIDNERGHTKDNVVGSCIRCNLARGSMPYEAWLRLTPTIRQLRVEGLFGSWLGN